MTPDDPRHGEYRGHQQHRKDGEDSCDPCKLAAFRHCKQTKHRLNSGIRNRIPLGEEAWQAVRTISPGVLARTSGVPHGSLSRLRQRNLGPETIVARSTRDAILRGREGAFTPVGLARRLQAVTAMGWPMRVVAEGTPFLLDAYKKVRGGRQREFVQYELGVCILEAYERYAMTPAPDGASSHRTRRWAERFGYHTALAWEGQAIDDPAARPAGVGRNTRPHKTEIDHAAVLRAALGDRDIQLTQAERGEVVRILRSEGWSDRRIEIDRGIKADRYDQSAEAVA